jgi:hypothetical protein
MTKNRTIEAGDYIKTVWDESRGLKEWRGRVRRVSYETALIEWSYAGGLPTDICTNVLLGELKVTKRLKTSQK